jgi:ankyrin repeat protein
MATFRKRIAQEKAASNLGPRPNELRPDAKEDAKGVDKRMEQAYRVKKYLQDRRHGNRHKQSAPLDMSATDMEKLNMAYEMENELSAGKLSTANMASFQFRRDFENFTQDPTSLAKVQNLQKNLSEAQCPRRYSIGFLNKAIYTKERLSLASVPSHSSETCSSVSKRTSLASDFSSVTARTIRRRTRRSIQATQTRDDPQNVPLVENSNMDEGHIPYGLVQGFPHVDGCVLDPSIREKKLPLCCLHRCRGDPRVVKCDFCLDELPKSHRFVRDIIRKSREGEDVIYIYAGKPISFDFHEVDGFGDTVLHLAASLGAGCMILSWLLSLEVDVHARNGAGQTFMHVLNPASLAAYYNHSAERVGDDGVRRLFHHLRAMDFDYNLQDDFGQTPLHSLTQHWLNIHLIKLLFHHCLPSGPTLLRRDFQGRTVEERIKTQAPVDHNGFPDQHRERVITAWLQQIRILCDGEFTTPRHQSDYEESTLPPASVLHDYSENGRPTRYQKMRETITRALSGFPKLEYRGRNALHCLAESCSSLKFGAENPSAPGKRKRQEQSRLRHDYIVDQVDKLLKAGVSPDDYDVNGNTPLMAFIRNDLSPEPERQITADVLRNLIKAGANVHRRNNKGETALHLAMRFGRPSAVDILLNNLANVHVRARRGEGICEVASKWALREKKDGARYHRILICMDIAGRYSAVLGPRREEEWDQQRHCSVGNSLTSVQSKLQFSGLV